MDALECLKTRRSVRAYEQAQVDRKVIEDIVDCGRLAATAINIQPWQFVAVTDRQLLKQIASITDYGKFIEDVSCCVAVFCEDTKYYLEDGSAATQNILLAAHAHCLGSCWVAGDKKAYCAQIRNLLKLPDKYKLVSLVAIGRAESVPSPAKKSLDEVLHWEQYSG